MAEREYWRQNQLWKDVNEGDWNDWRWQVKNRITKLEDLKKIIDVTPEEDIAIAACSGRLSMAITPYFSLLMSPDKLYCPIRMQAVPTAKELHISPFDMVDPCGEDSDSPVKGLVHRYPDRVLLLATDQCAMYCRHCTRRRCVGAEKDVLSENNIEKACDYMRSNKKIRDVLISGGDPFLLPDEKLERLLKAVREVPQIEFLRIGTRTPVTLPQRITPELVALLKKYDVYWVSIHFNHPKEITRQVKKACDMLAESGIVLGSQTVLLRGINDRLYIMKRLMHALLEIRVRPYYIYQCDPASGTSHFRTPVSSGINIIEKLRGFTSGYAVPTYVIDAPGGGGKIPIAPNYVVSYIDGVYTIKNYEGKTFTYKEEFNPQAQPLVAAKEA